MKKIFSTLVAGTLFVTINVGILSCSKDDTEDVIENIPPTDETVEESAKYDIVGCWVATYTWKYSGIVETITMDINKNGTLSFIDVSTNGKDPFSGSGRWEYNHPNHNWTLSTNHSLVSGTYRLVSNQLINAQYFDDGSSRTIIFDKQRFNMQGESLWIALYPNNAERHIVKFNF